MVKTKTQSVRTKRIYEDPKKSDGVRILVDRIWPRGIRKEDAEIDLWLKDLAPTKELRQWFDHDPAKWPEFRKKYRSFLQADKDAQVAIEEIRKRLKTKRVTLLYAAKDEEHNNAVVLAEFLE